MEHTITANGVRHGHTGGLVLSQLHIVLAAGFALVACLTAFGGGVIVGMWYKASEQHTPVAVATSTAPPEKALQSAETTSPSAESPAPVTFYNTLTSNQVAYAPLTPPAPAPGSAAGGSKGAPSAPVPAAPPVAAPAAPKVVAAAPALPRASTPEVAPDSAKPASAPKATVAPAVHLTPKTPPVVSANRTVAPSPAKVAKEPDTAKPVPTVASSAKPAPAPTSTPKATPVSRPASKETDTPRSASAAPVVTAKATRTEDFSVQVGSFGSAEQAERLRTNLTQKGYPARVQPSSVPGQGLRYRVRVGNYAERTAADQTAHHLTAQEQVPAMVAGRD